MIRGFRTLIVDKSSQLDYSLGNIKIRNAERELKINLNECHTIIIENIQTSISLFLIKEMTERNITVIYCDEKHLPLGELSGFYNNYESSKRFRDQLGFGEKTKLDVWLEITRYKIVHQQKVLEFFGLDNSAAKLYRWEYAMKIDNLLETEAKSASEYFRALMGSSFNRRDENIVENASFNYIYAILLASTARYITALGYKTELGLWHRSGENKYNLASDLMEPWRPIFDLYLLKKIFAKDDYFLDKGYIRDVLNQKIKINNAENYFNNAIEIYVQSVFRALLDGDVGQILMPDFEVG